MSTFDIPAGTNVALELEGTRCFNAAWGANLYSHDLRDPRAPHLSGELWAVTTPGRIVAADGFLASVGGGNGVEIFEVRSGRTAVPEVEIPTGDIAHEVAVNGALACVAEEHSLEVFDVSNPLLPVRRSGYGLTSSTQHVAFDGRYAYLSGYAGLGFSVVDLIDPASPQGWSFGLDRGVAALSRSGTRLALGLWGP